MYSQTTETSMAALEARLMAFGLKPTMRLTYNAVIVATIPTSDGGYIEVEYSHLGTGMFSTYGHAPSWSLEEVLNKVGLPTTTEPVTVTHKAILQGDIDLDDGYLYNGNPVTFWGLLPGGVLELDTVEGTFSLELPCTLNKG